MTIFVLGGSGFIGRHVCRRFVEDGSESVVSVGRRDGSQEDIGGLRYAKLNVDVGRLAEIGVGEGDTVIHLASSIVPRTALEDSAAMMAASVSSAMAIGQECVRLGVERLIYTSSGGTIYGARQVPADEQSACFPVGFYATHKLVVESALRLCVLGTGTRLVTLRISNPFGSGQRLDRPQGLIGHLLASVRKGTSFMVSGDGSQVRDYLDVRDVAEAYWLASRYGGECQVFNIGSGIGRSIVDVITSVEQCCGVQIVRHVGPRSHDELSYSVLNSCLARRELAWQPCRDFRASLAELWDEHSGVV